MPGSQSPTPDELAHEGWLLSQIRDSVIVTDLDGRVTYWNEGATRLFGWTRDEMIGRPLIERFPLEARAAVTAAMEAILQGNDHDGEWQDIHKDGSALWIDARLRRLTSAAGETVGIIGVSHDITARKRAEAERDELIERLQGEVERFQLRDQAIQAVAQGILVTDPAQDDNPVIYVSPGFERLTGYSAADLIGRNCRMLQGPDTDPQAVARVRAAIKEGRNTVEVLLNYRKDGTTFWNELSICAVRDRTGRLTHFVGVQADVTDRRRLEENYRHAQKMEAVALMAGGVAHEFNNQLTIVNGYSALLAEELSAFPPGEDLPDLVKMIREAGERLAMLTRQILAVSRHPLTRFQLVDVNGVIIEACRMFHRTLGADVRLVLSLHEGLGRTKVDPAQLEQVVLNLLANAREAMPRGGTITVETTAREFSHEHVGRYGTLVAGSYLRITIRDDGTGMTPEVQARLFEPFFTTKEVGQGTGLGLAMVHGIVMQSGGHIEVVSQTGKGTSMELYLPVAPAPGSAPATASVPAPEIFRETILLVEDEASVRTLVRQVLAKAGYRVIERESAGEARRYFEGSSERISLVILGGDLMASEAAALIEAARARNPRPGVLLCPGSTIHPVPAAGATDVHTLPKPYLPSTLVRAVRDILGGE